MKTEKDDLAKILLFLQALTKKRSKKKK